MSTNNDVLPIAGAAGVGLLALAGIGVAVRRRKRDEDDALIDDEPMLETSHEQIVEPVMTREPTFVPAAAAAAPKASAPVESDDFHEEFDLEKYGPHVQAAYRGPSEDNPSLSLRKRLKRGAALDQMARLKGESAPVSPTVTAKPTATSGGFMLRAPTIQPSFRPAFQS